MKTKESYVVVETESQKNYSAKTENDDSKGNLHVCCDRRLLFINFIECSISSD